MTDVVALFENFKAKYRAGESPDPSVFVDKAGAEQAMLAALIASFLETEASPPVSATAIERVADDPMVPKLSDHAAGQHAEAGMGRFESLAAAFQQLLSDKIALQLPVAATALRSTDTDKTRFAVTGVPRGSIEISSQSGTVTLTLEKAPSSIEGRIPLVVFPEALRGSTNVGITWSDQARDLPKGVVRGEEPVTDGRLVMTVGRLQNPRVNATPLLGRLLLLRVGADDPRIDRWIHRLAETISIDPDYTGS